ncbi:MAG: hypothetical protein KJ601_06125 [Nanoarchaeota archaeon]|nr:hypothetical protein [Nanoarchaeota archaeon]
MRNKHVGLLIIGIAIFILFIVISFNNALESIVNTTCTHGAECPMYATLGVQKAISYGSMVVLAILGGLFYFMKDEQDKKEPQKIANKIAADLEGEEKQVMDIVIRNDGSVYQSDIIKDTGFTKVKVSRVLDKLEGRQLIDRKRRGMTNVIIAK